MKIKMKFVRLKALGMPMYKISKELGVHRTTLTLWHQELAPYILIAKQDAIEEMLFENGLTKLDRINCVCSQLDNLYGMLCNKVEDKIDDKIENKILNNDANEEGINKTLDQIYKLTKILHLESNEKGVEKFMKGSHTKMKINTMEPVNQSAKESIKENPEEDKDSIFEEAPLWITDIENFTAHQPAADFEEPNGTNLYNAKLINENESLDINTDHMEIEDIMKKEPSMRKTFTKVIRRRRRLIESGLEESVNNPSKNKNEIISEKELKKDVSKE